MVILNADHPDVEEFIWCKAIEERKARALRDAGFDMDLDGKDSHSIQYQNANNSVRVTDEFMQAVVDDADWDLKAVTTGETIRTVKARRPVPPDLAGGVGVRRPRHAVRHHDQPVGTPRPTPGASTPATRAREYMHLDNSACNLASINLLKYLDDDGTFDVEAYKHTVEVMFTAQEILVGNADYPTEKIAENSRRFRQLGLGLRQPRRPAHGPGPALRLRRRSGVGRRITALMTGHAYATSARTAGPHGSVRRLRRERRRHAQRAAHAPRRGGQDRRGLVPPELLGAAQQAWDEAVELGETFGVRNSQASVLAPTGTIGLMMDCDTTGIEPDLALTKAKKLVGGGTMFIVNQTIPRALRQLGYSDEQVEEIVAHIDEHKTIIGAPALQGRAPAGVRLLDGRQHDPLHGSREDDGCGAAVHLGRHQQVRRGRDAGVDRRRPRPHRQPVPGREARQLPRRGHRGRVARRHPQDRRLLLRRSAAGP